VSIAISFEAKATGIHHPVFACVRKKNAQQKENCRKRHATPRDIVCPVSQRTLSVTFVVPLRRIYQGWFVVRKDRRKQKKRRKVKRANQSTVIVKDV